MFRSPIRHQMRHSLLSLTPATHGGLALCRTARRRHYSHFLAPNTLKYSFSFSHEQHSLTASSGINNFTQQQRFYSNNVSSGKDREGSVEKPAHEGSDAQRDIKDHIRDTAITDEMSGTAEHNFTRTSSVETPNIIGQQPQNTIHDNFQIKSTSQMLRELEKKKEDLNLKPRQFSDISNDVSTKLKKIIMSIPPALWRAALYVSDRSFELLRDPMVAKDWAAHITAFMKKEAKHYWAGGKLLYADLKSAVRIMWRVFQGHSISRREKMQLKRATADIVRMVPVIPFIVIPFLDFLLPFAIKLFPKMLPSQFEDKMMKEEELKRKLRARLELAKFLQDTVELMVVDLKKNKNAETVATAQELHRFISNIRDGQSVTNEDIVRFAKLFNDELTLDSIDRLQLIAMCRFMDIAPYGSNVMLRFNLRNKLRQLKADDRLIYWEGVNSLSDEELTFACQERGMRIGLPKYELRRQLNEWLQLSLDFNIPNSLLILSRAFGFTSIADQMNPDEAIKMAIGSLPKNAIDEVLMDQHDDSVSINEKKLEALRRQEMLIEEEERDMKEKELMNSGEVEPDVDDEYVSQYKKNVSSFIDEKSSLRDERRELTALSNEHETVNDDLLENAKEGTRVRKVHEYVGKVIGKLEVDFDEVPDDFSTKYHKLDKDSDGLIDVQELKELNRDLKNKVSDEMLEKIIEKLDANKDGKISVSALRAELIRNAMNG